MDPNSNANTNPNPAFKPEDIDPDYLIEEKITDTTKKHYVKGKILGKGGFAKCYEFTNLENNKLSAAKVVLKASMTSAKAKNKLASEIKIHKSLSHPNIVSFEHVFEDEENCYILMEICSNGSMHDLIKRRKRFTELEVQCYIRQIIHGVKYLHSNRVIHRDLKMGNLLLNDKMELKICDFGLATQLDLVGERRRTVCGTPNYIAPEIIEGNKNGHSYEVDVWSLGVILYTLLVGKAPFETPDVKMTYKKIKACDYVFPEHIPLSDNAKLLVQKILHLDPSMRPSLDEILEDPFFKSAEVIPKLLPVSTLSSPPSPKYISQLAQTERAFAQPEKPEPVPLVTQRNGRLVNTHRNILAKGDAAAPNSSSSSKLQIQTNENIVASQIGRHQSPDHRTWTLTKMGSWDGNLDIPQTAKEVYRPQTVSQKPALRASQSFKAPMPISNRLRLKGPKSGAGNEVSVTKWSDFSNKYGMGYTLSNGATGVFFIDNSKIICDPKSSQFEYTEKGNDKQGTTNTYSMEDYPKELNKKITLLHFFKKSLEGNERGTPEIIDEEAEYQTGIYVKMWTKTRNAILFRMSNKTVQVIFTDRTEIIMSPENKQLTFVNKKGDKLSFPLSTASESSNADMTKRFRYAKEMLSNMVNGVSTQQGQMPNLNLH